MLRPVNLYELQSQAFSGANIPRFNKNRTIDNNALKAILDSSLDVLKVLSSDSDISAGHYLDTNGNKVNGNFQRGEKNTHPLNFMRLGIQGSYLLSVCLSNLSTDEVTRCGYVSLETNISEGTVRTTKISNISPDFDGQSVTYRTWDRMPVSPNANMMKNEIIIDGSADYSLQVLEAISAADKLKPLLPIETAA